MIAEAMSWVGTPFRHRASAKGVGVDCARSLIAWFSGAGVIDYFEPPEYSATWFLHRDEEVFLGLIAGYAVRLPDDEMPLPADIAMYRFGRCVAHGALIVDEEFIVHACSIAGRVERRERSAMRYAFHSHWRVKALA